MDDQVHEGQHVGWIGAFLALGIEETCRNVCPNVSPHLHPLAAPPEWMPVLACAVHAIRTAITSACSHGVGCVMPNHPSA